MRHKSWKDRVAERIFDLELKTSISRTKIVGKREDFHGMRKITKSEDINVVVEKILDHLGLDIEFVKEHINLVKKEE